MLLARKIGEALGDAMTQNILERVLGRLLYSAGLLPHAPRDVWAEVGEGTRNESTNVWALIQGLRQV